MIKKIFQCFLLLLLASNLSAQIIQRFYVDFGLNDVTNGNNTLSPDVNGNYWNNISSTGFLHTPLLNSNNKYSEFSLILYSPTNSAGILQGGLLSPEIVKLGDMSIPTATQDFIYSTTPVIIKIRGLHINNGYKFHFFGSRDNASNRSSNFDVKGMNTAHGTLKTSGTNLGGTGKNYNNSIFYVTDTIKPDISGEIVIEMSPSVGGFAYLNMMKIEELDITDISSIEVNGNNISISNDSSQMSVTIKPSNASYKPILWSVDDTTVAIIQNNGLLIAKKNGLVNVTATINQNGSTIISSKKVFINNQFSDLTPNQRLFVDFGPNDITNGNNTLNPSLKGNFWNNINPTNTPRKTALVNSVNQSTGFNLSYNSSLSSLGIQHGGLLSPEESKLGEMAVATATQDFFYTFSSGSITLGGLNNSKAYQFTIFGSREYIDIRKTTYTINGLNSCSGILQTSGKDLGGIEKNYNNNSFYGSEMVIPDSKGEVEIKLLALTGGAAYLNMMRVEEFDIVNPTSLIISGDNINLPFGESKMEVTILPSNATPLQIKWTVSDSTIASINSKSILEAKQNGNVTVSASCLLPNGQTISGFKEVLITEQITDVYIGGSAITKGEPQKSAIKMNKVYGISGLIKGIYELSTTFKNAGSISFYASQTDSNMPKFGMGESKGLLQIEGQSITPDISGEALVRIDLIKNTYAIYPVDTMKISLMGSSVAFGQGATSYHGWFYQYGQLLNQRYISNEGSKWYTSNISIPGNNTINLLDRWDSDLLNDGSQYVVYALSFGNEGIIGGGQAIFDQYKRNIALLIYKARSSGKIPILTNCYGRNGYTAKEYNFTKQMDLIIHQLDVPSFNLLGALDNGSGGCPTLYMSDTMHPNDIGHTEMSYAIVPSVFEALKNKKPIPKKVSGTYLTMGKNTSSERLEFRPENTIHSFTTSFDIRTNSTGIVGTFMQSDSVGVLKINDSGSVSYLSPYGGVITSTMVVNDGNWHKITLSHYYAWGTTFLYTDSISAGSVNEKLTAKTFYLNNKNAPNLIDYRDWMFYRSAMNADEIMEMNHDKLLKSSLELYSPLDGLSILSGDTLINLAQSMNKLKRIDTVTGVGLVRNEPNLKIFPNPVVNKLTIKNLDEHRTYFYSIFSLEGKVIKNHARLLNNQLDVSSIPSNNYILILMDQKNVTISRFEFQKK